MQLTVKQILDKLPKEQREQFEHLSEEEQVKMIRSLEEKGELNIDDGDLHYEGTTLGDVIKQGLFKFGIAIGGFSIVVGVIFGVKYITGNNISVADSFSLSGQVIEDIDTYQLSGLDIRETRLRQMFDEIQLEIDTTTEVKRMYSEKYNEADKRLKSRVPEFYEKVLDICK